MEMFIYMTITIVIVLIGTIATLWIANSKENKEGDSSYDKKTGEKWIRLTVYYVVAIVLGFVALVIYISYT